MDNKNSFLGTGWAFPPTFVKEQKNTKMISNEEDIKSSLHILLTTRLGERVMFPEYGCNLEELLFESLNRTLITYTVDLIKTAILYHEPRIDVLKIDISILYHEPRIDVLKIDISETDPLEGKLMISIDYMVRATNSRTNVVFPFYKEEGTNIS